MFAATAVDSRPKIRHRSNVSNKSSDSGFVDNRTQIVDQKNTVSIWNNLMHSIKAMLIIWVILCSSNSIIILLSACIGHVSLIKFLCWSPNCNSADSNLWEPPLDDIQGHKWGHSHQLETSIKRRLSLLYMFWCCWAEQDSK